MSALLSPHVLAGRRPRLAVLLVGLLAAMSCGGEATEDEPRPAAEPADPPEEPAWFADVTQELGLGHGYHSGARGELHMPESVPGGCALFDADGDGDLDVLLANGNDLLPEASSADSPGNVFYRQEADGRFVDASAESGLDDGGYGMGLAVGDVDDDGDLDVFVANYGPDRLYLNQGGGRFEPAPPESGVVVEGWSSSAAFVDYDADGRLDLYVTRYIEWDPSRPCLDRTGRPDYCGPASFEPLTDRLFHNLGDGRFEDVSAAAGIESAAGAGLGVIASDFDGDGLVDLYVANDGWDNHLWMNRGDGTFANEALVRGAAYNMAGRAEAGMGLVADDLDGDGHEDLFLTHLTGETNTFLRQVGDTGRFDDWTGRAALGADSRPFTGFGVVALDLENDTDLDLVVVNGGVQRAPPLPGADLSTGVWAELAQPNRIYLNDGAGRFESASPPAGGLLTRVEVGRGLAAGDFDRDGDLDLLVTSLEAPARLYRNEVPKTGHWLLVRARLPERRRDALGARVTVRFGGRELFRTIRSASSYQSASEPVAHFGLGAAASFDEIEVRWPDGSVERFPGGAADRALTLLRGEGERLP